MTGITQSHIVLPRVCSWRTHSKGAGAEFTRWKQGFLQHSHLARGHARGEVQRVGRESSTDLEASPSCSPRKLSQPGLLCDPLWLQKHLWKQAQLAISARLWQTPCSGSTVEIIPFHQGICPGVMCAQSLNQSEVSEHALPVSGPHPPPRT